MRVACKKRGIRRKKEDRKNEGGKDEDRKGCAGYFITVVIFRECPGKASGAP